MRNLRDCLGGVVVFYRLCLIISAVSWRSEAAACKVHNGTQVDCRWRGLRTVPGNLPPSTTVLDLSYNTIASFPARCFATLHKLQRLTMLNHGDWTIDSDAFAGLRSLVSLEFTGQGFITFGEGTFAHLPQLQTLVLKRINNFLSLPADPLSNLGALTKLTVSGNYDIDSTPPARMPSSWLRGLVNLEELHVDVPDIANFSSSTFQDQAKLKVISIQTASFRCVPIEQFKPLKNIEVIKLSDIDGVTGECNVVFPHFAQLKELSLNPFAVVGPSVPTLDLTNTSLDKVFMVAYGYHQMFPPTETFPVTIKLGSVRNFHLYSTVDARMLETFLYIFKKSGLQILKLNIEDPSSNGYNLTETLFEGLNGTNLEELDFSENDVQSLYRGAFQWLTRLQTLLMSFCKLDYLPVGSFDGLNNLRTLSLRGNYFQDMWRLTTPLSVLTKLQKLDLGRNRLTGQIPANAFASLRSLKTIDLSQNKLVSIHPRSFHFASELRVIGLSDNDLQFLASGTFSNLKSLQTLQLIGNEDLKLGDEMDKSYHPFRNSSNLTTLTINLNPFHILNINLEDIPYLESLYITAGSVFPEVFFPGNLRLPHLKTLVIENVKIISQTENVILGTTSINLQPQQFLQILRLPNNNFNRLDFSSLNKFINLEELSVANNKISAIIGTPTALTKLRILDLSGNSITYFNPEIMRALSNLQALSIYNNPFDCSCKLEPFHDWMTTDTQTSIYSNYDQFERNICSAPKDKEDMVVDDIEFGWECNIAFMVSLPLVGVVVLIALSITVCKKFHWHLRYGYFLVKLKLGGYQLHVNDADEPRDKKYDAFVVYNEHDREWIMQELVPHLENADPPNFKLCIHERDFVGGNDIIQNILDSIEESHKTVLVLSPHFAESEWCYFEMRMAQSCLFEERRDIITMVLLEEIPDNTMPRILRNILLTKRYIKWPENELGRRLFWEKLKRALRSESRVNRVADL